MKALFWIFTFLLFSILACRDSIGPIHCEQNNPCSENACYPEDCVQNTTLLGMDTLWSLPLGNDLLKDIILDEDNIYLNMLTSNSFKVLSISKKGEFMWEYSNSLLDALSSLALSKTNNTLIGKKWNAIFSLNSETGNEQIFHKMQYYPFSASGILIDNEYYTTTGLRNESEAYLMKSDINDLQNWETVYTLTRDQVDGSGPNIESVNKWTNPETGDEILVFQHRMAFPKRIDLVAYNMTADSIYWWHKDIDPEGDSNYKQIDIVDGKAFFMGLWTLFCYDIESGKLIWENRYFDQDRRSFGLGDMVFTEDKNTMVVIYHEGMMALNTQTGQEIWHKTDDLWNVGSELSIYKDIVFFTHPGDGEFHSNTLWAIDAHTGEELWRKSSFQFGVGGFTGPVAIDQEKGILYTYGSRLYAIKIPEEW
jgi:outer membrane protein assembly factor BamB